MPVLHYQCPHCTGVFQVDPAMAGQQVACPTCQGVVAIGVAAASDAVSAANIASQDLAPPIIEPQSDDEDDSPWYPDTEESDRQPGSTAEDAVSTSPAPRELLGCPHCGGAFQVTAEMAGQQMACPHCRGIVTIPGAPASGDATAGNSTLQPDAMMAFRIPDNTKKIVVGDRVVEVRRLTPEEKAKRRLIKRVVLIGFCTAVLIGSMIYLVYFRFPNQ
ncbi:MAG: hypothetical protein K8T91_19485 [Planctomycetes bacterium]|nr:hypothetical protein [Planctomycetota bacterium]